MKQVLVSAPYMIPTFDRFRPVFDEAGLVPLVAAVEERLSAAELMPYAGKVDGVICGDDLFSGDVLTAFTPRLKVISKWGTGIDSIDTRRAAALGIEVLNTPDAFTEAVADSVLGYVLAFARQIPWADRSMKAGDWKKVVSRSLSECVLGVVGVGRIGKAVLRRARAFGMTLLGNDVVAIDPDFVRQVGVEMVSFEELLRQADYVSLNCDLNPTSQGLMDGQAFARMKATAVLINTARGPVVEEQALVAALRRGGIAGAALDVFEEEPLPASSPLRSFDSVLLSPHNANSSPRAWERVHQATIANLCRGLGIPLPDSVRSIPAFGEGERGR